jgi:ABC-type branched-subunit amino acid transport system substrate-binding protein
VDQAVNSLRGQKSGIKAVIMVASYRAAAKFIEKTHDLIPNLIYTNTSFTGSTQLANELMLLGQRFAPGVIVTQVLPNVGGNSSEVLQYKDALAKYFPNEADPDYVSFEGYVVAKVLIEALKKAGPDFDTETLTSTLEEMRDIDFGLGTRLNFTRADHQASHQVWGTVLDSNGLYQYLELN